VRAMQREARLTGIDEPVRSELEITAHLEVVARMAADAVAAGAQAAHLSIEQQEALTRGMTGYFGEVAGAGLLALPGEVVDG
jgi:hypothetical protein